MFYPSFTARPFRIKFSTCELKQSSFPLPTPLRPKPLRLIFTSECAHEKLMMWETLVSLIQLSLAQKQMSPSELP